MDEIVGRIARGARGEDLVEVLSRELAPTDLQTLLLEVARRRAERRTPAEVLRQYREDRFVRPSRADPRLLGRIDHHAFASVPPSYAPIVLAPIAPLGACSAIATVSQNKIVSTMRTGEVISDASNVLVLECVVRRAEARGGPPVSLCASGRMTRAQALARPEHSAHFQLFVTVSVGRDPGGRAFQERAVIEMIGAQMAMLRGLAAEGFRCEEIDVVISPDDRHHPIAERARDALASRFAGTPITIDGARIAGSGYYRGLAFAVYVRGPDGSRIPLGDGGLTDWAARLTGDRKERTMVGAIGTELLGTVLAPSR